MIYVLYQLLYHSRQDSVIDVILSFFVETMVGKLRKENRVTMLFSVLVMSIGVILYFGAEAFYNT